MSKFQKPETYVGAIEIAESLLADNEELSRSGIDVYLAIADLVVRQRLDGRLDDASYLSAETSEAAIKLEAYKIGQPAHQADGTFYVDGMMAMLEELDVFQHEAG